MKTFLLVLVLALKTSVVAARDESQPSNVTFSTYASELKLASFDEQATTHTFRGHVALNGTLFLEFDMEAPDKANGEVNSTKFVPDPESTARLPAVTAGFYPGPVNYVSLIAPKGQIVKLFGGQRNFAAISHGTSPEAHRRAKIVITDYLASVECDSRIYSAHVISIVPLRKSTQLASAKVPDGC